VRKDLKDYFHPGYAAPAAKYLVDLEDLCMELSASLKAMTNDRDFYKREYEFYCEELRKSDERLELLTAKGKGEP
jgi:hypothetical protein